MKKFSLRKLALLAAFILGFLAMFMYILMPVVNTQYGVSYGDSATADVGGLRGLIIGFGIGDNEYAPSVYMLAFILPVLGALMAILAFRGFGGEVLPLVAAVCFFVGGIIYFLPLQTVNFSGLSGEALDYHRVVFKGYYDIGFGAIFGGILSILAAIASAVPFGLKVLNVLFNK